MSEPGRNVCAKVAPGDVHQSKMLRSLADIGVDAKLTELPFTTRELACWLMSDTAGSMATEDLITAIKVCSTFAILPQMVAAARQFLCHGRLCAHVRQAGKLCLRSTVSSIKAKPSADK